jgi:hypothetical protein
MMSFNVNVRAKALTPCGKCGDSMNVALEKS